MNKLLLSVFILSFSYWAYLSQHTSMEISCDAVEYQSLGSLLQSRGFIPSYFEEGPRREPLFPTLIACAMQLSAWFSIPYAKIMALFGVGLLFITQYLLYRILNALGINLYITALTLLYFGFSPAIVNTAFSLYSEILLFPLILAIVLVSAKAWAMMKNSQYAMISLYGCGWGFLFALGAFSKGALEIIYLLSCLPVLVSGIMHLCLRQKKTAVSLLLFLSCSAIAFFPPVMTYKALNAKYNGSFTITNRFPWMFYGSAVRRSEPLTPKKLLTALAYTPGEGVCSLLFSPSDCFYWSFQTTDGYGMGRIHELSAQGTDAKSMGTILLQEALQKAGQNPPQFLFLQALEGSKMFFWESTQIGFVTYPPWLKKIYDFKLLNNALRFMLAALSLASVLWLWGRIASARCPALMRCIGSFIFVFIFMFSFISILTRYALPIAPLFLISIAFLLEHMYNIAHEKDCPNSRK